MDIYAKEFTPKSFALPQVIIWKKKSSQSDKSQTNLNQCKKKEGTEWSKNHFTNIVAFFDFSEKDIHRLLLVSTRMRGAVLSLIPRFKTETY